MAGKALGGLKVIELAEMVSGPYCAKMMADLGADVIKIEKPRIGDVARRRGPFLHDEPHPERSALFHYVNTNKRGITLDIATAQGKQIFERLIADADVLVEDSPPGAMAALGVGYDRLASINKRLVMTSITPFGQTGPNKDYKGYNLTASHASGEGYIIGATSVDAVDRPPLKAARFVTDYEAGCGAASATLMALLWRGNSGLGQQVDLSKQEWGIGMTLRSLTRFLDVGESENRVTGRYPTFGLMPCKDGYVHFQGFFQWESVMAAMGNPAWANDERFATRLSRAHHASDINENTRAWMKEMTREEVCKITEECHIPCGPVNTPKEILEADYLKERGFLVEVDHPETGALTYVSAPYVFSETPWALERPAPLLGQHNREIFCDRLGLSEADLDGLREARVI